MEVVDPIRTQYCDYVMQRVRDLQCGDQYCDVDVKVANQVFKCHRLILSAASEYFHIKFSGQFGESYATEITLDDIQASVFKEVREFMYTGKMDITCSDVYDFIRAAETYKLPPEMVERCVQFMQQNLDLLADHILEIFSYAVHVASDRMKPIVELLSRHICENFAYFYRTAKFFELTFDDLKTIMSKVDRRILRDTFLEGIFRWIQSQVNLPNQERMAYFDELLDKRNINFISADYYEFMVSHYIKEFVTSRSPGDNFVASNAIQIPAKTLHAYVARDSIYGFSFGTSIFARHSNTSAHGFCKEVWEYCGELRSSPNFMRNVVIDNHLYSLTYVKVVGNTNDSQLTFSRGSLVNMYPCLTLKPPPLIMDEFDMCGMNDNIYVYNKNTLSNIRRRASDNESTFSEDELSRGIFLYKRDANVGSWLPLPCPKKRFDNACMTCNEQLVYLIGGSNSNGYVQAYDFRMQKWITCAPTLGTYDKAACCVHKNKIWVAGGEQNPHNFEMYDPISGRWTLMTCLTEERSFKHQLVDDSTFICSFNNALTYDSEVLFYDIDENMWYQQPNLYKTVDKSDLVIGDNIHILDMVNF